MPLINTCNATCNFCLFRIFKIYYVLITAVELGNIQKGYYFDMILSLKKSIIIVTTRKSIPIEDLKDRTVDVCRSHCECDADGRKNI